MQGVKTVNLWLGSNVMVEYSLEEALKLLEENLQGCKANLKINLESMDLIKDNLTITEVSIARVHNYDVEQRRAQKPA
jgi:prefoldin subunit 5